MIVCMNFMPLTDDVFNLPKFLDRKDFVPFIDYMIRSRGIGRIVVSNSELGYSILPHIRLVHPDVVIADYNHMEEEWWMEGGYPRLAVENTQTVDRHLVTSRHLKDWLVQRGVNASAVEVVYISVDVNRFKRNAKARKALRSKFRLGDDHLAVCFSGRLAPQKQPDVLGKTILSVLSRTRNATFFICGTGPNEGELREQLAKHTGTRCHFLGDVSFADMPDIYSGMDVLFLPSLHEGISLAIYEAMASSCAIVGARVGGQAELVSADAGVLIESGAMTKRQQAEEYSKILRELASEPGKAAGMGRQGRQLVVRQFSQAGLGRNFLAALANEPQPARPAASSRRYTLPVNAVLSKVVSQAALLAATASSDWRLARDRSSRLLRLKWYLVDHHPAIAERLAPIYRTIVARRTREVI
jgi:glycosyltransferase involved in cell wall biosynthesis